jgi:hypothetical protein
MNIWRCYTTVKASKQLPRRINRLALLIIGFFTILVAFACNGNLLSGVAGGQGSGGDGGSSEGNAESDSNNSSGKSSDGNEGGDAQVAESSVALLLMQRQPVTVYDYSGSKLGVGELSVYQPDTVQLTDSFNIRLNLVLPGISTESALGEPTLTPALIPDVTGTPSFIGQVTIHQLMGAELRGIDTNVFDIQSYPEGGMRYIEQGVAASWEWSLRAKGKEALGVRKMMIVVYLPRNLEDHTSVNQEVIEIPVTFTVVPEVVSSATMAPGGFIASAAGVASNLATIAAAITSIGGAVAIIWGAFKYIERGRKQRDEQENIEHKESLRKRKDNSRKQFEKDWGMNLQENGQTQGSPDNQINGPVRKRLKKKIEKVRSLKGKFILRN